MMDAALKEYLKSHDIVYEYYEHPPVKTVEESQRLANNVPGTRTKNLFMKDDKNQYYLIVLPSIKRLSSSFIKAHLKVKKLEFASPEELWDEVHVRPGSVSICNLIFNEKVHLILDAEIWSAEVIGSHPNLNNATIVLTNKEFRKLYSSLVCTKEILNVE